MSWSRRAGSTSRAGPTCPTARAVLSCSSTTNSSRSWSNAPVTTGTTTCQVPHPTTMATQLRAAIARATGCTASVGIGPNRLLARLATRHAQPDGQHAIGREEAAGRLAEEEVGSLPGVGSDKQRKLLALGVETCAQLLALPASTLRDKLGPKVSETLRAFARAPAASPKITHGALWPLPTKTVLNKNAQSCHRRRLGTRPTYALPWNYPNGL